MTDPRDLIQRLADSLAENCSDYIVNPQFYPEVAEARAYLAAHPEPAADGSTFTPEEAEMIAAPWSYLQPSLPTPISPSERFPTETDCDAEGRCWVGSWNKIGDDGEWIADWELTTPASYTWKGIAHISAWLPAHALPLPEV